MSDVISDGTPPARLLLTPAELAAVAGGAWTPAPAPPPPDSLTQLYTQRPDRVPVGALFAVPGGRHDTAETIARLTAAEAHGAGALLVDRKTAAAFRSALPCLVADTDASGAIRRIARAVRDATPARRVLVTGTEGKSGFKNLLHHMLAEQTTVHASTLNNNMMVQIAVMLANIQPWHAVAILEVACPSLRRAQQRSAMVRPHVCVITEVGFEHLTSHGSADAVIENKATVTEACLPGGTVILPAMTGRHARLRAAVDRRWQGRVLTFGTAGDVDARLLERRFDPARLGWHARALVMGQEVAFFCQRIEDHVPVSCLAPLLACHALGHDVARAAAAMADYRPFRTEGRVRWLTFGDRRVLLIDKSQRGYLLGQADVLRTLARLRTPPGGRKILVWGDVYTRSEYGEAGPSLLPPETLRPLVTAAGIDRLYTCGTDTDFGSLLPPGMAAAAHLDDDPVRLLPTVLADLRDGDILTVNGDRDDGMPALVEALREAADRDRRFDDRRRPVPLAPQPETAHAAPARR